WQDRKKVNGLAAKYFPTTIEYGVILIPSAFRALNSVNDTNIHHYELIITP
ncbi:3352_t:CDS:1, partial [Funneliformis mosseae]